MRRGDDPGDLGIELIAPDASAFGDSEQADFVGFDGADDGAFGDEPRGSRKVTAIAGVLVVGLIAVGVVAASPWGGDEASPASTTVPTTTPAPTTIVTVPREPGPPGLVLDDPSWTFAGAWPDDGGRSADGRPTAAIAVFTDGTAAPTRWIVVMTAPQSNELRADTTRIEVDGQVVTVGRDADGATHISLFDPTTTGYEPTSAGDRRVIDVRASSTIPLDRLLWFATTGALDAASTFDDLSLAWSGAAPAGGIGPIAYPGATTIYRRGQQTLLAAGSRIDAAAMPYLHLILPRAVDASGVPLSDVYEVQGATLGVRASDDVDGVMLLYGLQAITASDIATALDVVRPATTDEWADLAVTEPDPGGTTDGSDPVVRQAGTLTADGVIIPWTATVGTSLMVINTSQQTWYGSIHLHDGIEVRRYSAPELSVVLVSSYWPTSARRASVRVGDAAPVELPLEQIGDEPVWVTALALTELGEVTVELFDGDGTSIGTYTV